jgi:hypothetical protein
MSKKTGEVAGPDLPDNLPALRADISRLSYMLARASMRGAAGPARQSQPPREAMRRFRRWRVVEGDFRAPARFDGSCA